MSGMSGQRISGSTEPWGNCWIGLLQSAPNASSCNHIPPELNSNHIGLLFWPKPCPYKICKFEYACRWTWNQVSQEVSTQLLPILRSTQHGPCERTSPTRRLMHSTDKPWQVHVMAKQDPASAFAEPARFNWVRMSINPDIRVLSLTYTDATAGT